MAHAAFYGIKQRASLVSLETSLRGFPPKTTRYGYLLQQISYFTYHQQKALEEEYNKWNA
jgi:hypothetical protein